MCQLVVGPRVGAREGKRCRLKDGALPRLFMTVYKMEHDQLETPRYVESALIVYLAMSLWSVVLCRRRVSFMRCGLDILTRQHPLLCSSDKWMFWLPTNMLSSCTSGTKSRSLPFDIFTGGLMS